MPAQREARQRSRERIIAHGIVDNGAAQRPGNILHIRNEILILIQNDLIAPGGARDVPEHEGVSGDRAECPQRSEGGTVRARQPAYGTCSTAAAVRPSTDPGSRNASPAGKIRSDA